MSSAQVPGPPSDVRVVLAQPGLVSSPSMAPAQVWRQRRLVTRHTRFRRTPTPAMCRVERPTPFREKTNT